MMGRDGGIRVLPEGRELNSACARAGGLQLVWGRKAKLATFLKAEETTIIPQEEQSSPRDGWWRIASFQGTATRNIAEGRLL
jgi:hypothetical protein